MNRKIIEELYRFEEVWSESFPPTGGKSEHMSL